MLSVAPPITAFTVQTSVLLDAVAPLKKGCRWPRPAVEYSLPLEPATAENPESTFLVAKKLERTCQGNPGRRELQYSLRMRSNCQPRC
jgi:hypothetical protein